MVFPKMSIILSLVALQRRHLFLCFCLVDVRVFIILSACLRHCYLLLQEIQEFGVIIVGIGLLCVIVGLGGVAIHGFQDFAASLEFLLLGLDPENFAVASLGVRVG